MSVPTQRVQRSPAIVFPTESDFEKFKPLLEVYLRQWFSFLTSVKGSTSVLLGGGNLLPPGGTTGQVLEKTSNDDYAATWETPTGGGGSTLPGGTFTGCGIQAIDTTTGFATVLTSLITNNSYVFTEIQDQTTFSTPGQSIVYTRVPGVSFEIVVENFTGGAITGTAMNIAWLIIEP